jgi:hypothetical protein
VAIPQETKGPLRRLTAPARGTKEATREPAAMETFELSPDGRKSIATYRTLEQAIEHAQGVLPSRPDVGQFRIQPRRGSVAGWWAR